MKAEKRKYEWKLKNRLYANKTPLLAELEKEWYEIQKTAKREELVRRVKEISFQVTKTLLFLLVLGGVFTVVLIAPKVFVVYDSFTRRRGFFNEKRLKRSLYYLKRHQYIKFVNKGKNTYEVQITKKGVEKSLSEFFDKLSLIKQPKWDGLWRIVVFDIPEKHKWEREGFRRKLSQLGLYRLQKSVFVTPYPCEKEISLFVLIFNISPYVHFIETKYLSNDGVIKKHFGLK